MSRLSPTLEVSECQVSRLSPTLEVSRVTCHVSLLRPSRVWVVSLLQLLSDQVTLPGESLLYLPADICVQGEWVAPNDVCLHDKLYTWIILIVILMIVILIILLVFFIYFAMDSCIRHITYRDRRRYKKQVSSESGGTSCNSDDSYIYGRNLSVGECRAVEKCKYLLTLL